jgi:hypothetical protein
LNACGIAETPRGESLITDVDHPTQERSGRQNHSAAYELSFPRLHPGHTAVEKREGRNLVFDDYETGAMAQCVLHRQSVELAICLRTGSANSGAFGAVQHSKLNAGLVGNPAHKTVHCVYFTDEMTFAQSTDGGIA